MRGRWRVVFGKELLDALRDPRSLMSALLYPLIGPVLVGILIVVLASEPELELPIVGPDNAPHLVEFIEQRDVTILPPPEDPEQSVLDGDHPVVMEIPEGFEESFRKGDPARVRLIYDDSRTDSLRPIAKTRRVLLEYDQSIGSLRLLARGVSPRLAHPVALEEVNLSTPQKMAARIMNMLPVFLILAAFFGGMQVAIDATAGERERGSLEALLANPVSRAQIVIGKWATTVLFSSIGVVVTLIGSLAMMAAIPLEELGLALQLRVTDTLGMLAAVLPLVLLSSALQMLVASFARSFKEAQTYLSALLFLPMLPGLVLSLFPMDTKPWMLVIPALAQSQLVGDLMRGEGMPATSLAIATGSSVLLTLLSLWQCSRIFSRERIVFGS